MSRDGVLTEALASFAISGESKDEIVAVVPTQRRRLIAVPQAAEKVGRSRFAGDFCADHGPTDDGLPCAKFSHLPGKGKGVKQPSIRQILVGGISDLVRPVVILALLIGGLYGFNRIILHGGFGSHHVLRPKHSVSGPASRMPNGGKLAPSNTVRCTGGMVTARVNGVTTCVYPSARVVKK